LVATFRRFRAATATKASPRGRVVAQASARSNWRAL
jgi:hypothetical protein